MRGVERKEERFGWALVAPALSVVLLVAVFPLVWTLWESLHLHDLRMPWKGYPFVGAGNYLEAVRDPRLGGSLLHTFFFTVVTVSLELIAGLFLALALRRRYRYGRAWLRTAVLLPWAIPTVVSGLLWRFMFETHAGIVNAALMGMGILHEPLVWFTDSAAAWVPVILADVWRMTPFVTLLLLAGLQNINDELYEAARMDGAGSWQQFRHITLPLLRPALLVVLVFRILDAFRVFDLIYVLTSGGPGTSTEPVALYAWSTLLQNLRFGYGSAISVLIFLIVLLMALGLIRWLGRDVVGGRRGAPA
ncbi:MAG: ABC transporter permease subunit [Candidatus Eisenbacteria bacterium]|nr:ABC transporter permease subunit [Candidatus Eisenbacteria bacterium]